MYMNYEAYNLYKVIGYKKREALHKVFYTPIKKFLWKKYKIFMKELKLNKKKKKSIN